MEQGLLIFEPGTTRCVYTGAYSASRRPLDPKNHPSTPFCMLHEFNGPLSCLRFLSTSERMRRPCGETLADREGDQVPTRNAEYAVTSPWGFGSCSCAARWPKFAPKYSSPQGFFKSLRVFSATRALRPPSMGVFRKYMERWSDERA